MTKPIEGARKGRPPKFSARTCRIIYRAIILGDTQSGAARLARVEPNTFSRWKMEGIKHEKACELDLHECLLNHGDEAAKRRFATNLKRAEQIAIGERISNIRRIGKKEWTADAWWLERRHNEEWGKKEQVIHSGDVNHNTNIRVELHNVTPQQRLKIADAITARAKFQQALLTTGDVVEAELVTPQEQAQPSVPTPSSNE
jgi:hypothetical protein